MTTQAAIAVFPGVRMSALFRQVNCPVQPDDEIVTAFRDGEVTLRRNRRSDGFTESDKFIGYKHVRPGDLVIHAMDSFAGAIGVSDSSGKVSPVCTTLVARQAADPSFYALFLRNLALSGYIESLAKGIRERSTDFRWQDIKTLSVPDISASMQQRIVEYLDRETAEIDELVATQQRLISQLEERRRAVIAHAVTRGLDPDAPLKPSGLSWPGQIPQDWQARPIKSLGQVISGAAFPIQLQGHFDEGIAFLKVKALSEEDINTPEGSFDTISHRNIVKYGYTIVPENSIAFAKIGAATLLWRFPIVRREFCIDNNMAALVSKPVANIDYLKFQLLAQNLNVLVTQGTIPTLSLRGLQDTRIPVPPLSEQRRIAAYLDEVTGTIDETVRVARHAIELARERRQALISEVVTGRRRV